MRTASLDNPHNNVGYIQYSPITRFAAHYQNYLLASGCMRQEPKNSGNALDDTIDSESRLRLIVNKTPALIYSARPDGYIDFFNQQCLEFLGLPFDMLNALSGSGVVCG
jgi:PAS domain-containing protein